MNLIITKTRSRLLIKYVSNLTFIKLHGSPLEEWKSEAYVKKLLRNHHSAIDQ